MHSPEIRTHGAQSPRRVQPPGGGLGRRQIENGEAGILPRGIGGSAAAGGIEKERGRVHASVAAHPQGRLQKAIQLPHRFVFKGGGGSTPFVVGDARPATGGGIVAAGFCSKRRHGGGKSKELSDHYFVRDTGRVHTTIRWAGRLFLCPIWIFFRICNKRIV